MRWSLLVLLTFACDPHDGDDDTDVGTQAGGAVTLVDLDPDIAPVAADGVRIARWASWQRGLTANIHSDIVVVPLDEADANTLATVSRAGAIALCGTSVGRGSAQEWPAEAVGHDTEGGSWLDIRADIVQDEMLSRISEAASIGCDGVTLWDADAAEQNTGLPLTVDDQRGYARLLANAARNRGLAVAMQASVDDVVGFVDAIVQTNCLTTDSCFVDTRLATWSLQDSTTPDDTCRQALIAGTRTLIPTESGDVSCDTSFPEATRLAQVQRYGTYYAADPAVLHDLGELDLAIVQPLLTADQLALMTTRTQVVAYLSIGEIGLSNTYLIDGEELPGQVVFDAHPEWFLAENPWFDSWFADTNNVGWQDFVLEQADLLIAQGYDGIFMDTVDTVDVYPDTLPGMVTLIHRLREQHPQARIVQNRGMNVIPQSGPDVDALMFEVFSTRHDHETGGYALTDTNAPGYAQIVEKAVDYRLSGGVVLAQDFAEAGGEWDDVMCFARERAEMHGFVSAFADAFFQDAPAALPPQCPWPEAAPTPVRFDPPMWHTGSGSSTGVVVEGTTAWDVVAHPTLTVSETSEGLSIGVPSGTPPGAYHVTVLVDDRMVRYPIDVHEQTVFVANAGLSDVVAYDEPDRAAPLALAARSTANLIAQPYALDIAPDGTLWVAENVGDPTAAQPAGRVLGYDPFDLSSPTVVLDSGLSYPTGLAVDDSGTVWVANSALDWTGTPRGTPSIVSVTPTGAGPVVELDLSNPQYGYPRSIAFDSAGTLWMTTTWGLIVGYDPGQTTPMAILALDLDGVQLNDITTQGDSLWVSGQSASRGFVARVPANSWAPSAFTSTIPANDITVFDDGLFGPWGIAHDGDDLWVVNSTDAIDDEDSRGALVQLDAQTGAVLSHVALASRYTLGIAVY